MQPETNQSSQPETQSREALLTKIRARKDSGDESQPDSKRPSNGSTAGPTLNKDGTPRKSHKKKTPESDPEVIAQTRKCISQLFRTIDVLADASSTREDKEHATNEYVRYAGELVLLKWAHVYCKYAEEINLVCALILWSGYRGTRIVNGWMSKTPVVTQPVASKDPAKKEVSLPPADDLMKMASEMGVTPDMVADFLKNMKGASQDEEIKDAEVEEVEGKSSGK